MKKQRIIFILTFLIFGCMTNNVSNDKVRKESKSELSKYGLVWLRDNIYIDQTEISNFNYLEYIYWLRKHRQSEYKTALPDTNVWNKDRCNCFTPLTMYYFKHPAFRNYPVVGVNYQQALKYCEWRTEVVNRVIYNKEMGLKLDSFNNDINYPVKLTFRLPKKEEWEYAAKAGLDNDKYPFGYVNLLDKNGMPTYNTQESYNIYVRSRTKDMDVNSKNIFADNGTQNVTFGKPNRFGIYNLLGNVSERITDTTAMGLNFNTTLLGDPYWDSNYSLGKTIKYQQPNNALGFRCACEVRETR